MKTSLLPRALISLSTAAILGAAAPVSAGPELIITEINYHPTDALENWEFVEIKNVGDEPQAMAGYTIGGVGNVTFTQPTIQPGGFLVLAKSAPAFNAKYGFLPGGTFDGNLKNSGEEVKIVTPAPESLSVFSVDYWDGGNEDPLVDGDEARPFWPSDPDGGGYTLVPMNPNVNPDPNDYRNWRPSISANGGSPGADEPLPSPLLPVFINEIRTRDGANSNDAIEFFNPNATAVNIGSWFLSDNLDDPKKSPVPPGTVVPAGGFLVLQNGVDGFTISLSSQGERVFLYSADGAGDLTGYVNGLHFGASGDGLTFSRLVNSVGAEQFPAAANTLGAANSAPLVGPVVITEIMYDPNILGGPDEFVEIQNISGAPVKLYDPARPTNNWRLEGTSYIIAGAQPTLAPGEIALITPTAPAAFRAAHPGVPAGMKIFGPYAGSLNNGGEEVALQRPENLDDVDLNKTSYINVDVVLYDNASPWPTEAAGLGRSIVRTDRSAYGNDPANWEPSQFIGGSPGVIYDYTGPRILLNEVLAHTDIPQTDVIELYNPTGSAVDIGNWWLSDDKDVPKKFRIPDGTMIPAGGFWAVNQDNDAFDGAPPGYFGNAFQISSRGDSVHLFSADSAGELTGYRHGFSFRATVNGAPENGNQSLGRYVDTFGREHFTKQVLSFEVNISKPNPAGAPNHQPVVGPVVISEIYYDPAPGGVEFIELKNTSGSTVLLYDTTVGGNPNNTWLFDGITFAFPTPTPSMAAGATMVILPQGTDVANFKAANGVPAGVVVYGGAQGYTGALNNGGEEIVLLRPDRPDLVAGQTIVPLIPVDLVNYQDSEFWPAAGGGASLEKFNLSGFSDDPINWRAGGSGGTPGTTPVGISYDLWALQTFTPAELGQPGLTGSDDDVNGDGIANIFAYAFGYDPHVVPGSELFPQGSVVDLSGSDFFVISFRERPDATDLNYVVEYSGDLAVWETSNEQIGAQDNGDGTETVQFHSGSDLSVQPRLFMRVRVSKN